MNRFDQTLGVLYRTMKMREDPKLAANPSRNYRLFQDCTTAQLLDPAFAGEMVRFCYLEVSFAHTAPPPPLLRPLTAFSSPPHPQPQFHNDNQ